MTDTERVWFITGASSNFGVALTRALLKAGYCVVATARTVSKIPFEPTASLLVLPLDVGDPISISDAFDVAVKTFGRVDIVVIKAGIHACGELESIPEAAARDMFDVQLWGVAHIQAVATSIFEAQHSEGLIMNISSALAVFNAPLRTMISASKSAAEVLIVVRARTTPFVSTINIRPGAFEKEPKTDFYPQLPAYASKDLGRTIASSMRKQGSPPPGIGNVNKMAASLISLAELPKKQRPGAVSLGSDAYAMARVCAKKRVDHLRYGQLLFKKITNPSSGARAYVQRVWFITNAHCPLGHALVRVLISAGQNVAVVVHSRQASGFTDQDGLLLLEQNPAGQSIVNKNLDATIEHFGRVDVVVNAVIRHQLSSMDEWVAARALLERVFWGPIHVCSAAVKTFREHKSPSGGARIFNILTTPEPDNDDFSSHSAANAAMNAATTSLVRELPRKWNIAAAALTIDYDLLSEDETARVLLNLANVPNADLPSRLPIGPRAVALAQHAAENEQSEVLSEDAMARAMETDYNHIDGRARIGLTESIFALVLSPAPSILGYVSSVLAALGWGIRLVVSERIISRFAH